MLFCGGGDGGGDWLGATKGEEVRRDGFGEGEHPVLEAGDFGFHIRGAFPLGVKVGEAFEVGFEGRDPAGDTAESVSETIDLVLMIHGWGLGN